MVKAFFYPYFRRPLVSIGNGAADSLVNRGTSESFSGIVLILRISDYSKIAALIIGSVAINMVNRNGRIGYFENKPVHEIQLVNLRVSLRIPSSLAPLRSPFAAINFVKVCIVNFRKHAFSQWNQFHAEILA